MTDDREDRLADAGWASDIFGPDDFSELQEKGEDIEEGKEYFYVMSLFDAETATKLLEAYAAGCVSEASPEQQLFLNVCINQFINGIYMMALEKGIVVRRFWELGTN